MKRRKIIQYLGGSFALSLLSISTIPFLTSCSTVKPTFTVTNTSQDGVAGGTTGVSAIGKGYYFNDVNAPGEVNGIEIPPEHKSDVEIDLSNTQKIKDTSNQTQYARVSFIVKDNPPPEDVPPWDIKVNWTIKHTNFKKTSTITIAKPKENTITIDDDFIYADQPSISSDVTDTSLLETNSIQCIDGVYNDKEVTGIPNDRNAIETHLTNDLVWLQYLMYSSLKYVSVDDSTNTYSQLDDSTGKLHIQFQYNYHTQIFDYINVNIEASATIYTLFGISFSASVTLDYNGGEKDDEDNSVLLLGAFTAQQDPCQTHYPQGFDPNSSSPTYTPYTQDFLQLVPKTEKAYQTYNFNINSSSYIPMSSKQHLYFLNQPRFLGLQYTTGTGHVLLRDKSKREDADSFRNGQLTIPSYTLSGMSYDLDNHKGTQPYPQVNIQQCYADISREQSFSNYLAPGNVDDGAKAFMFNYDFTDVDFDDNPDKFIADQTEQYAKQLQCLESDDVQGEDAPGMHINIYKDSTKNDLLLNDVPFYQIIQQASPNGGGIFPNSPNDIQIDGNLGCLRLVEEGSSYVGNIIYDHDTSQFTKFVVALSYMFETDNMGGGGKSDNVFYYTPDELEHITFNNNPSI